MCTVADKKAPTHSDAFIFQHLHFTQEGFGIQYHARADDTDLAAVQASRRDQMQDELLSLNNDSVSCIVPALVTGNDIELFSQQIDNLPFTFIAPLGANHHDVCHDVSLAFSLEHTAFCGFWS